MAEPKGKLKKSMNLADLFFLESVRLLARAGCMQPRTVLSRLEAMRLFRG